MYESKYSKYLINNYTRFAEEDEIMQGLTPVDKYAGVPLFEKNGVVYGDSKDNHSMSIGPTGCGKSRGITKILLRSIIKSKNESAIVNDPKGELFAATANIAREARLKIKVLNLRKLDKSSHHWNPLSIIYRYYVGGQISKAQQAIDEFATELMSRTKNDHDRYWDMVAASFVARLIELCLYFSNSEDEFTLENILPLCNENSESAIRAMLDYMPDVSEAIKSGLNAVLDLSAERTKSCIYGVIHTGLDSLVKNDSLLKLFNSNDIDFYQVAKEPTIIYIIYPDEKSSMNNVVKSFLSQAYTSFLDVCDEQENNRLPITVNFVLDEFSNLAKIEAFDNRISESRSKGIRYHLFCQSMNQLTDKYSEAIGETILSNCTNWIIFSSKETKLLESISRLCGRVVDYEGREKPLISSSELQYLEKGDKDVEVLVLRQGIRPYITKLPYYDCIYQAVDKAMLPNNKTVKRINHKLKPSDWIKRAREHSEMPNESLEEENETKDIDGEDSDYEDFDLQAELEKRFDELFGPLDDED